MNDAYHRHSATPPGPATADLAVSEMLACLPVPAFLLDGAGQLLAANLAGRAALSAGTQLPDENARAQLCAEAPQLPGRTRLACGRGALAMALELSRIGSAEPARFLLHGPIAAARQGEDFALAIHDLRTQLQSIIASGDLLAEQGAYLHTEAAVYLQAIQGSAQAALAQVSDALRLAHDDPGGDEETISPVAPTRIIEEIVQRFQPLAMRNGCKVEASLPAIELWVKAPDRAIQTLVENLLGNAIKFSQSEKVTVRLEARPLARDKKMRLAIEVIDHGIGLPKAQRDRIERIFSKGGVAEPDMQGHGLGTYAIRKATDLLGGTIKYHDTKGGGATFRAEFTLPTARVAQRAAPRRDRNDPARMQLDDVRILIVDDNDVNRTLFERILSSTGAEVVVAPSGEDALDQLEKAQRRFNVVLLDLSLPGSDGISVASMVEQSPPPTGHPVVIGLTAHTEEDWLNACEAVGMRSVLTKPLRPELLRQTVAVYAGLDPAEIAAAPVPLISAAVYDEIQEEMGPDMAVSLARKAVSEAEAFCDRVMESGITQIRRQELHSALGSSGMTGLSRVELALRRVQSVSRVCTDESAATTIALDLLREAVVQTAGALEARAGA